MMPGSPRAYIVDDDPSVTKALLRIFHSAGIEAAAFASAAAFLDAPDAVVDGGGCIVLDVSMPDMDGLALQEALVARGRALPIVFLTAHGDIPMSVRAIKAGAIDFLTKPVDQDRLLKAVDVAFEEDRRQRRAREAQAEIARRLASLTTREREVLGHLVAGKLNKQVAAALGTVEKTIKVHRAHIMLKLGVRSMAEVVRITERAGIRPADS